jgi:cytochrome bd-type quinol oxidase subunit 1
VLRKLLVVLDWLVLGTVVLPDHEDVDHGEDFDDIIFPLMIFCAMSFVLSMIYIFVIRKYYSTKDEPIEDHEELAEHDENRV